MRVLGAIIAGGRASRFGGDKALALWQGRPLIAWARDAIAPYCARIVVCGREWGDFPSLTDLPGPGLGPLGGIAAALAYAQAEGFPSVLTIGCDMPDTPAGLLTALVRRAPAFCPDAPILGHWHAAGAENLRNWLEGGQSRAVRAWAAACGAEPIPAPVPLHNVNTPADLIA